MANTGIILTLAMASVTETITTSVTNVTSKFGTVSLNGNPETGDVSFAL